MLSQDKENQILELNTQIKVRIGVSKIEGVGVIALTKALAKAYPQVRFNSVSPGYVETDMAADWPPDTYDRIKEGTVVGRIAQPEEIAHMILFLASDKASYITGADFLADGCVLQNGV